MNKLLVVLSLLLLFSITGFSQLLGQWRGLDRSGVYPETGLLTEWPKEGPPLLWSVTNLAVGYSSVTVVGKSIYTSGSAATNEVLIALTDKGQLKWKSPCGRLTKSGDNCSRSTPTVEGNKIYVSTGRGDITCVDAQDGKVVWQARPTEDFEGTCGWWGYAESPLLCDDKVFFAPGGKKTAIVAYDKNTGKLAWTSESLEDKASMVSPLLVERGGRKLIVTLTEKFIIGVDPENGKILWKFDFGALMDKENNHAITPIYCDGKLYVTSGYKHKSVMLKLAEDGSSIDLLWTDSVLDAHIGGVVKVGKYIYGSNFKSPYTGNWVCLDWESGKVQWETEWICKGAIISADGFLYCVEEKTGTMGLVKASPEKFDLTSSFKVPLGSKLFYAHPVIKDGILYIRHGEALMAYNIKKT